MINDFKLQKFGIDFMGYEFALRGSSYHHLLIPRRHGGQVTYENGVILMQDTAHNYLHTIERYDEELFNCITGAMVDEKWKGHLDISDLRYIKDCLQYFEGNYSELMTKKGKPVVKQMYITKRKI